MNTKAFDFSVDKEHKTIIVNREYAAPRDVVWNAYTNKDILDQWWAPKPWKARTKSMDFHEGGKWLYAMEGPAGEVHWSLAQFRHIEPGKKYTGLDAFTDADGNINKDMPQSEWKVHFGDLGQGTLVTITILFEAVSQMESYLEMGFKEGLSMAMDNLDAILPSLR